jgi:rubrerythrin
MILEPIKDFSEEPFRVNLGDPVKLNAIDAIEAARILEEQRESFYTDAAEKIKALSEVSRALKQIAKKRAGHKEKL